MIFITVEAGRRPSARCTEAKSVVYVSASPQAAARQGAHQRSLVLRGGHEDESGQALNLAGRRGAGVGKSVKPPTAARAGGERPRACSCDESSGSASVSTFTIRTLSPSSSATWRRSARKARLRRGRRRCCADALTRLLKLGSHKDARSAPAARVRAAAGVSGARQRRAAWRREPPHAIRLARSQYLGSIPRVEVNHKGFGPFRNSHLQLLTGQLLDEAGAHAHRTPRERRSQARGAWRSQAHAVGGRQHRQAEREHCGGRGG
jgi:hypothetical protein